MAVRQARPLTVVDIKMYFRETGNGIGLICFLHALSLDFLTCFAQRLRKGPYWVEHLNGKPEICFLQLALLPGIRFVAKTLVVLISSLLFAEPVVSGALLVLVLSGKHIWDFRRRRPCIRKGYFNKGC